MTEQDQGCRECGGSGYVRDYQHHAGSHLPEPIWEACGCRSQTAWSRSSSGGWTRTMGGLVLWAVDAYPWKEMWRSGVEGHGWVWSSTRDLAFTGAEAIAVRVLGREAAG